MRKIKDMILRAYIALKHGERGATAVEYGIMVALIAAVIIATVTVLGTNIRDLFQAVANKMPTTVP